MTKTLAKHVYILLHISNAIWILSTEYVPITRALPILQSLFRAREIGSNVDIVVTGDEGTKEV